MRHYILSETNYAYTKANPYEVAVLPLGATEPHNLHLPYGTDMFEGTIVGEKICEAAHRRGGQGRAAADDSLRHRDEHAPLSAGDERRSDDAVSLRHRHRQVAASHSGVRKIVLLNSHGGNEMKPLLRELADKIDGHLFLCNWYTGARRTEYAGIFEHADDHAGEMETSFILAYSSAPRRQNARRQAGRRRRRRRPRPASKPINRGWVSITRPWHLLTTNTGSGYPHAASPEKAEKMLALLAERLGTFLVELSAAKIDERFPY